MIKAKNTHRLAIPAVLTLILCCVASAGPTYSFLKIAGEWSFYDDGEGLIAVDEVVQVNRRPNGIGDRRLPASEEDEIMSLPAVGSVINLSSGNSGKKASYLLLTGSSSSGSAPSGSLSAQSSDENVTINGKPYPGTSADMLRTTLRDGLEGPDRDNGWIRTLPNGKPRNIPNGNAWGYWKKDGPSVIDDDDMASPVPVPVPGSVILAAIGAGLVKLLHDRRLKR